jgi:crossover junction endodeoxyribonuclease RusA
MSCLRFTIHGPPRAKQRPRIGRGGNTYTPSQTRSYEGHVRTMATLAILGSKGEWMANETRDVAVTLYVFWPTKRRGDLDNVAKAILDGCNRCVYADDRQVVELHCFGSLDPKNPHVGVRVELASPF